MNTPYREVSQKLGGLDVSASGSRAQLSVLEPLVSNATRNHFLGILLVPDDHLLHHDGNLPGVDGVVEGIDEVEASPGRLDFSTVGE